MIRWATVALVTVLVVGTAAARTSPTHPGEPPEGGRDSWGDHDIGNVVCSVSDIGVAGYMDFPDNLIGNGFMYPAWVRSLLFEASILVGTDDGGVRVSDAMRDSVQIPNRDFAVAASGDLVISAPGPQADQQGYALYNDRAAPSPIGVEVEQDTYSWASDPYDDFVIFRYVVTNRGASTVGNVYVGMFMDWDVATTASDNSNYDYGNDLGWATGATGGVPYAGIVSLSHRPPATFRSLSNANEVYPPGSSETDKWDWISSGFVNDSNSNEDLSLVMADGPFTLAPGASEVVGFALVGGDDLADLQANAQAAHTKWPTVPVELSSFTATLEEGAVRLLWTTQSEQDLLGFHLYRSLAAEGAYEQITDQLIPGAEPSGTPHTYSYLDGSVRAGTTYWYELADVDLWGVVTMHGPVSVLVLPSESALDQNVPNPFSTATTIRLSLNQGGHVTVKIYNVAGELARTLHDGRLDAGAHELVWDGLSDSGTRVAPGMYTYTLRVEGFEQSRALFLVR